MEKLKISLTDYDIDRVVSIYRSSLYDFMNNKKRKPSDVFVICAIDYMDSRFAIVVNGLPDGLNIYVIDREGGLSSENIELDFFSAKDLVEELEFTERELIREFKKCLY